MNSFQGFWPDPWRDFFGLSNSVPDSVVAALVFVFIYVCILLPSGIIFSFLERKLGADLQARVGPNSSVMAGFFQSFFDFFKLVQKKREAAVSWGTVFWLFIHTVVIYVTVAVLPLGTRFLFIDAEMSSFFPLLAVLALGLGTMLLGLSQDSVPGWLGGMRMASQVLAGIFPAVICFLVAGVRAGGFRWTALVQTQSSGPWGWGIFLSPFDFLAFFIFLISGLILLSIPPLDGGMSLQDIHGGVAWNLSGTKFFLFRLGRFYGFFLWSLIAATVFLGAWQLPKFVMDFFQDKDIGLFPDFLGTVLLLVKGIVLMLATQLAARVLPRPRADQITDLSWKVLSPLALGALVGAVLWHR